jgi:hypothetical protein
MAVITGNAVNPRWCALGDVERRFRERLDLYAP